MTTGTTLRRLRKQCRVSQLTLERVARLAPGTVRALEHDEGAPTLTTLRLLSAALTLLSRRLVRPEDLLGDPPERQG